MGQCLTLAHRVFSVRFATGLEAHSMLAQPLSRQCRRARFATRRVLGANPLRCIVVAWPVGLHVTSCKWTHD